MPSRLGHVLTWLCYQKRLRAHFPNLEPPVINSEGPGVFQQSLFFSYALAETGDVIYEWAHPD